VLAVGLITEPDQAQAMIIEGKADMVLLACGFLREPSWAMKAAVALRRTEALAIPPQSERGWSSLGAMAMHRAVAEPLPAL
jgi:2,4-dienoyl-CoA reductase-like NADH-dependent reductase (Old Yellow Enzyme family)